MPTAPSAKRPRAPTSAAGDHKSGDYCHLARSASPGDGHSLRLRVPVLVGRPLADGLTAEVLGCDIGYRFGQLPAVTGEVFDGAVTIAVLSVNRRLEHYCAVVPGAHKGRVGVVDRTRIIWLTQPCAGGLR